MKKKTKLWIGVPCGIFLLLAVAFVAVLLLGPNENRREVDRIDSECLELVTKVHDRESAEKYAEQLKVFFARYEKVFFDAQYQNAIREDTWNNILYDYCHNHWAIWFGSSRLNTYDRMMKECNRLYVAKSYGYESLQKALESYSVARMVFESSTYSWMIDRMFWKPSAEEWDRMYE